MPKSVSFTEYMIANTHSVYKIKIRKSPSVRPALAAVYNLAKFTDSTDEGVRVRLLSGKS